MKKHRFFKTFIAFFLIGVIGIVFLVPSIIPLLKQQQVTIPELSNIPFSVLVAGSLINPTILLIISIIVGQLTAPKLKLTSFLYKRINSLDENNEKKDISFLATIPIAMLSGIIVAVILVSLELLFQPYLPAPLQLSLESRNLLHTLGGVFYGGIVEEILIRWGLMSLFAWLLWKIFQRSKQKPSSLVFWISIMLSSILFAFGHLGATLLAAPLTPIVFARMLLLNGIGGIVFGWLFWKKGLEAAMISHATVHIATTLIVHMLL